MVPVLLQGLTNPLVVLPLLAVNIKLWKRKESLTKFPLRKLDTKKRNTMKVSRLAFLWVLAPLRGAVSVDVSNQTSAHRNRLQGINRAMPNFSFSPLKQENHHVRRAKNVDKVSYDVYKVVFI